ncbi:MAG TPA: MMPL family transporter [Bacteroidales bacterium]|nr:MMPL family transporter [Bacteroidales bacterium]
MWKYLVRLILRNRLSNLIVIILVTIFMGWQATKVQMSYEMARMLPESDSTSIAYEEFKDLFGQDGSVMFVGLKDKNIYSLDKFNDWYELSWKIREIDGVEEVLSIGKIYNLRKNDSTGLLDFLPVFQAKPQTQQELDSLRDVILSMPFYKGFLYNDSNDVTMIMVTLDKNKLNTKSRVKLIADIKGLIEDFGEKHNAEMHYSGLPYIRTITSKKIQDELYFFILLSLLIASAILLLFFRSIKAVFFTMLIVAITVIWVLGTVAIFNYKITILTGILPPLLVVIVVENCIFLLNKYHNEYLQHGNKVKALSRVVTRIGNANLLTNTTTAVGFAAFIITGNKILTEFGIIASLNIMFAYLLSLFLIPIFFSYLPPPNTRHTRHMEKSMVSRLIAKVVAVVQVRRRLIYIFTALFVIAGIIGVSRLETTGNIVDDISRKDKLYKDLMFFEKHFKGVMPLEISIDSKQDNGVFADKGKTLYKIKRLHRLLSKDSLYSLYLSRPVSVVDGISFLYQAHKGGDEKYFILPPPTQLADLNQYTGGLEQNKGSNPFHSFIDSTNRITRISIQMANIGTKEIQSITDRLRPQIDEIFPPEEYNVVLTGTSVVFLKGSSYLVRNALMSLLLAVVVISMLMALLFTSARMIVISLIPNLIPQLMTAALMGYLGIPIKPSTILIFSIALGISVDNAIHFLSRYRLQLKLNDWQIKPSVIAALSETGYSMIYSSVVLFFGFGIFILSSFGGTEALGYLIPFTLLMALLSNLFLLPSLLLSLDKYITTKSFREPLLEILDEEEDIELNDLEIEVSGDA